MKKDKLGRLTVTIMALIGILVGLVITAEIIIGVVGNTTKATFDAKYNPEIFGSNMYFKVDIKTEPILVDENGNKMVEDGLATIKDGNVFVGEDYKCNTVQVYKDLYGTIRLAGSNNSDKLEYVTKDFTIPKEAAEITNEEDKIMFLSYKLDAEKDRNFTLQVKGTCYITIAVIELVITLIAISLAVFNKSGKKKNGGTGETDDYTEPVEVKTIESVETVQSKDSTSGKDNTSI